MNKEPLLLPTRTQSLAQSQPVINNSNPNNRCVFGKHNPYFNTRDTDSQTIGLDNGIGEFDIDRGLNALVESIRKQYPPALTVIIVEEADRTIPL